MIRNDQANNEYLFETLLEVVRSEEFKQFTDEEKEFALQSLRNRLKYLQSIYPDSYIHGFDVRDVFPDEAPPQSQGTL